MTDEAMSPLRRRMIEDMTIPDEQGEIRRFARCPKLQVQAATSSLSRPKHP